MTTSWCPRRVIPLKSSFLLLFLITTSVFGQADVKQNIVSGYSEANTSNYSVQWTIGELLTDTFVNGGLEVTAGLNESNIVLLVTDLEVRNTQLELISAFPNPMSGVVTIQSPVVLLEDLAFEFKDASGKIVVVQTLTRTKNEASFSTKDLPAGFYLLTVKNIKTNGFGHIKLVQK